MPRRLTPKSTLEQLKREAKRWLRALRRDGGQAGVASADARARLERAFPDAPAVPTLRDVQHALARELGFSGWTELKRRLAGLDAAPAGAAVRPFEAMAERLLEAYRTGDPAALEAHWRDTWHRRTWPTMRTYVQLDLGKRPGAPGGDVDITIDDARVLVARDQGFESWRALIEHVARLPTGKSLASRPVTAFYANDGESERPRESSHDWDAIIGVMAERGLTGLSAHGQMTDDMLARVAELEQITALELGGSRDLSDAGLRHLARLRQLRYLDLSGTSVTDQGLAVLRELPGLERVKLAGTPSGDGAIAALAGAPSLRHLHTGNRVTNAGVALLHRVPALEIWRGGEPRMALTSYEAEPTSLVLRGSFTDEGLRQLAGLNGLFALNIDDSHLSISASGLRSLGALANLGWLAVDATDDAMPIIAAMPRLRFLGCQDTVAGDDGFVALSDSPTIEYIWGRRCSNLGSRGFAALARMPALRGLSVSCRNVGDDGLAALPRFPALTELMPMDVSDEGYRFVGQCERLESLVLMYCRETTDLATRHIARLPRLKHYLASYTRITDRSLDILSRMSSLERIELSGCAGVTNAGVARLASLPRLRELRLSGMQAVTSAVTTLFPPAVRVSYSV